MKKPKAPVTPAVRVLRQHGVEFTPHPYNYEEKGGTAVAARQLGLDEHRVIKTLVMEDDSRSPLVVLMHGDRDVSTKNLARHLGVRQVVPCSPDVANRHSGYLVGGTSPFGMKKTMPVYMEESILPLETVYLNGGKRGFLVGLSPRDIVRTLHPVLVNVAV